MTSFMAPSPLRNRAWALPYARPAHLRLARGADAPPPLCLDIARRNCRFRPKIERRLLWPFDAEQGADQGRLTAHASLVKDALKVSLASVDCDAEKTGTRDNVMARGD